MKNKGSEGVPSGSLTAGSLYTDLASRRAVLTAIQAASGGQWITGRSCLKALRPVVGVSKNASELFRLFKRRGMLTSKRGPRSAKKATQIRLTARAKAFLGDNSGKNDPATFRRRTASTNGIGSKITAYLAQFDGAVRRREALIKELAGLDKFIKARQSKVRTLRAALKEIGGLS